MKKRPGTYTYHLGGAERLEKGDPEVIPTTPGTYTYRFSDDPEVKPTVP